MPHLHLSSLVTKKKIETGVIFFHSTSRLCTYPYLAHLLYIIKCVPHCPVHTPPSAPPPTAHLSIPPQHPIRRTSRQERRTPRQQERTPRQERQARQQNTPRRLTQHPPPAANHPIATTPNVGAPFMTPVARQGETAGEPNTLATAHPTPATVRAADILPPPGGNGRHKWRPYDTPTPR